MTRWRGIFRSMAVPTLVFICPLVAVSCYLSWSLFLSVPEILEELSLRLAALLVIQAAAAALLCIGLMLLRWVRLPDCKLSQLCRGIMTIAILDVSLILATHPLKKAIFGTAIMPDYIKLSVLAIEMALIFLIGWEQICEKLDQLNRGIEPILFLIPLLIIPPILGGISFRPYDPMPIDPPSDAVARDNRPSVVLITMDAFAAQDASLYGYRLPTTPNLERLAHRSYNFTHFSSTCSFTTTAVGSLLTGMYPFSHRVFQLGGHLPESLRGKNLPALLKQHGYVTGAIVTNPYAHPPLLRIADAFTYLPQPPMSAWFLPSVALLQVGHNRLFTNAFLDEKFPYLVLYVFARAIPSFNHAPVVDERAVFDSAQEFISNSPTPFFLWVHVFPPHFPYMVRPPFRGRYLKSAEFTTQRDFKEAPGPVWFPASEQPKVDKLRMRYDEYITQVDDELGEFVNWLSHSPHGSNVILIVTADHGENFRHHFTHASPDLYYPELHIPLLISVPGQTTGVIDSRDADLTDIAPTILQLAGIEVPSWMEGQALLPSSKPSNGRPSFAASLSDSSVFTKMPAAGSIASTRGEYKYVWYFPGDHGTLFDISHDPEETENLAQKLPDLAAQMRASIRQRFGQYLQ